MIWKSVKDFPDYEVSEDGGLRRISAARTRKNGHELKRQTRPYPRTKLIKDGKKYCVFVHRIVCQAFHGDPPFEGAICRHLDDNPRNNHYTNLSWGTHLDNHNDRRKNGKSFDGERNGRAKLTKQDVLQIRTEYTGSYGDVPKLCKKYNICRSQMQEIVYGKSWKTEQNEGPRI